MVRQPNHMVPSRNVRVFAGIVAVVSVLASGYFAAAGLVAPGAVVVGGDTPASRTFAAYMAARSIVLLGAMVWLLAVRAWRPLGLLLTLNGVVQLIDATIGITHHQVAPTVGPICSAVALFVAARLLGGLTWTPGRQPLLNDDRQTRGSGR